MLGIIKTKGSVVLVIVLTGIGCNSASRSSANIASPKSPLDQGVAVSFANKTGAPSSIYTDNIGNGYLVFTAGPDGLRITNNDNTRNLLVIDAQGKIQAPGGPMNRVAVPSTSQQPCAVGDWSSDERYFYTCTGANTWKRVALSSW